MAIRAPDGAKNRNILKSHLCIAASGVEHSLIPGDKKKLLISNQYHERVPFLLILKVWYLSVVMKMKKRTNIAAMTNIYQDTYWLSSPGSAIS